MSDTIRVGYISSVSGTNVKVTYPDRQGAVTSDFPYLSNGVFRIPNVGEMVLVLHLSNGLNNGVCIGGFASNGLDMNLVTLKATLDDHTRRITALESKVTTLESKVSTLESTVSSLESRVSALGG